MRKNYSVYMFAAFLGTGSLIGLALAATVRFLITVPEEEVLSLYLLALGAGLISAAAIFLINYAFIRSIIGHFRTILARIQEEDYSARVNFSGRDMIGLLADDVNCALEHLEEKNDEVLHDELTGLPNRQFLKQYYRKNFGRLTRHRTAFLFFDLDKFKEINDQHGHLYGDKVLMVVAERVRAALADDEFLVRLSGDEFLLVANLSENFTGKDLAEQLMALFFEPFEISGSLQQVQTSIGVSTAPADGEDLAELIRKADFAMYEAKKQEGLSYYLFQQQGEVQASEVFGGC
ncbi:GGDEF domain-containing protein [Planomicrobium okeanokoites]|uniref:GGDEF domain-containing protein n=1 Tax=Planomicrobium okeanokoites TaxID=244 RepID=UPI00249108E1|nr:GGDEF domain-containing protein [Planomicrobium okeanokoites]